MTDQELRKFLCSDDTGPLTPRERALRVNDHEDWTDGAELMALIVREIEEAVLAEREACAKVSEGPLDATDSVVQSEISSMIRSRGEK